MPQHAAKRSLAAAISLTLAAGAAAGWRRLRRGHRPDPDDDPLGMVNHLQQTGRFARDTVLGGLFHWSKVSLREMAPENSLHITLSGNRLWAHIDRLSPLADEHLHPGEAAESADPAGEGRSARYSLLRAVAHNATHLLEGTRRLCTGRLGSHRLELECEVVDAEEGETVDTSECGEQDVGKAQEVDEHRGIGVREGQARGDARRGDGAALPRVPFSLIDEAVQIVDAEAAPWSIQMEARVAGRMDEQRLRAAVRHGLLRHPLAHARRAPAQASERGYEWELATDLEIDPLRVVECADGAALDAARADLYSLGVPLAESPPARLRLARHPDGDVLMLNVNHVAMDGFGVMRVLRSIARAYREEPDPVPPVDLRATRDLPALFGAGDAATRRARYAELLDKVRDLLGPPARLAADGGHQATGYGFHHRHLTADRTRALVAAVPAPATVNDLLLAALHLAIVRWNTDHGVASRRIGVLVPVNLWPDRPDGVVGNYSLPVRVTTTARQRSSRAALLEVVTAQTRRMKERGTGAALIEVLGGAADLPIWAKRALPALLWLSGNRLVDTAMLSNLGRIDDVPQFGSDAGATTALWFSAPARMPLGLAVGAATAAGRLHLVFRYRRPLLDADAARRFAGLYVGSLEALAG